MTNIHIGISGSANTTAAQAGLKKLRQQFVLLDAEMHKTLLSGAATSAQLDKELVHMGKNFAGLAADSGQWETIQKRVNNQTVEYTKNLMKQKVAFREVWAAQKSGLRDAAYQEQLRLKSAQVSTLGRTPAGQSMAQMFIPDKAEKSFDTAGQRAGFAASQFKSASTQLQNFGKNTQWAGRQLSVGFTMPLLAAGAATGYFAYQADKELTRIAKVYDTMTYDNMSADDAAMAKAKELGQLRVDGMTTAKNAAKQYGAAMTDTLAVQGELAATGSKGVSLQKATNETMRLATLGEMDYQTAAQATITLQSVFKQSSQELTDTFNYMNSVENQTSLSMLDFATAIPVAAAPIKALGGDMKDLSVLMVAMKARGVDAAEGANAIKSSFQRLLRPGKQVQEEFQQLTGRDIKELVESTKGELIPTLQAVGEATQDLSNLDKSKVLSGLFGTYQNTRMTAMLTGVTEDIADADSQVGRTLALGLKSRAELQATADQELQTAQQSASGKLKRAVESIKVDLAEVGVGFLEAATKIVAAGENILEFFSKMPSSIKNAAIITAVIVATLGPVTMLVGLFANMVGTVGKAGASLVMLATKFKMLDQNSVLAEKAALMVGGAFGKEKKSTDDLTMAVERLNASFAEAVTMQERMATAATKTATAAKNSAVQQAKSANVAAQSAKQAAIQQRAAALAAEGYGVNKGGKITRNGPGATSDERHGRRNFGLTSYDQDIVTGKTKVHKNNNGSVMSQQRVERQQRIKDLRASIAAKKAASAQEIAITKQQASAESAIAQKHAAQEAAAAKQQIALESKRSKAINSSKIGAGMLTASLFASLVPMGEAGSATEQVSSGIAKWGMVAGLALPVLGNTGRAIKGIKGAALQAGGAIQTKMLSGMSSMLKTSQSVSGSFGQGASKMSILGNGIKKGAVSAASLGGLINPWAGALAAAAGGAFLLYKHLNKAKVESRKMNEDVSGLSKIFGFIETEEGTKIDEAGNKTKTLKQQVKELNAEYPKLAASIRSAGSAQGMFERASFQGMKAFNKGASVDQARDIVKAALTAATDEAQAENIMLHFKFDPENLNQQMNVVRAKLKEAIDTNSDANSWNPFANMGASEMNSAAKQLNAALNSALEKGDDTGAKKTAEGFVKDFNKAIGKADRSRQFDLAQVFLNNFGTANGVDQEKIDKILDGLADRFKDGKRKITMDDLIGLDSTGELGEITDKMDQMNKYQEFMVDLRSKEKDEISGTSNYLMLTNAEQRKILQIAKETYESGRNSTSLSKDQIAALKEIENNTGLRLFGEHGILMALRAQNSALGTQAQHTAAVEQQRASMGEAIQADLTNLDKKYERAGDRLEKNHKSAMEGLDEAQKARNAAIDKAEKARKEAIDKAEQKRKDAIEAAEKKSEDRREKADARAEKRFDNQEKAQERRQDAEDDAFEKTWDAREKVLDDQETQRQQMFDAERNRISRLAELQSATINFNAAINTGDLDEAARIQIAQRATTESNNLDDLDTKLGNESDVKKETLAEQREDAAKKLQVHQDLENERLNATKKRYQEESAAAKKSADEKFAAQKKAADATFAAQKKAADDSFAAQKAASDAFYEAQKKSSDAAYESMKVNLDKEKEKRRTNLTSALTELQEYKGKSLAEWTAHINHIREKYDLEGGKSGKAFGEAAAVKMYQEIVKTLKDAGKDPASGEAGKDSLESWMQSAGKFIGLSNKELREFAKNHWSTGRTGGQTASHTGGFHEPVKGRVGYPSKAAPYPSEHMRLLKDDEYVVKGNAARHYGRATMDAINKGEAEVVARHTGGYGEMSATFGRIKQEQIGQGIAMKLAQDAKAKAKADAEAKAKSGGTSSGAPMGPVDPNGWNSPWKPRVGNGGLGKHDWHLPNLTPIYAPHSGTASGYDIPGHESRQAHGGNGYKSYGRIMKVTGGGATLSFAHLDTRAFDGPKKVKAGDYLGRTGMSGNTSGHHVHMELNNGGNNSNAGGFFSARGVSLRKGGTVKYDNTQANLHKGETVLTDNLTQKFKDGIKEFANGGKNEYNVSVTVQGNADKSTADQIANVVIKKLEAKESRKGTGR